MLEKFGVPLVCIIIDTMMASVDFQDANSAAETQQVMNGLRGLSQKTGAFVLVVDHFGKNIEVGTKGSSNKEDASDLVLAMLADRDVGGSISNTRMKVRKLRNGKSGVEFPFNLEVILATAKPPVPSIGSRSATTAARTPAVRGVGPRPCGSSAAPWRLRSSSAAGTFPHTATTDRKSAL